MVMCFFQKQYDGNMWKAQKAFLLSASFKQAGDCFVEYASLY